MDASFKVYNLFDFVRDIGGLVGGLDIIFRTLTQVFAYKAVYFFLTPELFEVKKKRKRKSDAFEQG